jgi:putative ABC transport system permease protein
VATDGPEVRAVEAAEVVRSAAPGLRLPASVSAGGATSVDLVADLLDFGAAPWHPSFAAGELDAVLDGGIVLAEKAAGDLGVGVGDTVVLRHPRRVGLGYELVDTRFRVAGLHPNPVRNLAYLDLSTAPTFGLEGITNVVDVLPAAGVSEDDAKRALFGMPGVASVQGPAATVRLFRDAMADYFGVLRIVEAIVLVLALLIAYNSATISVEERTREHATMLAFGLPPRTVLASISVEGLLVGLIGTAVGVLAGTGVVRWLVIGQLDETIPDLGVITYVSPATIVTAFVLGSLAVTIAPLLAGRRVRHIDIPSALRLLE